MNIEERVFYHIYPLGFCGAPKRRENENHVVNRLEKVIEWIPHMKYLGVNALYLGPVFESEEHGYDTIDYFRVDRRLGDNETLKKVVRELHNNDIKVVLDGVFNHSGREFWAFRDLQEKGWDSEYKDWYHGVDFSKRSPMGDNFTYNTWDGHYNLVKYNMDNVNVRNHLLDAAEFWIREFDIDGIRLDAADTLDFRFMQELSGRTKGKKNDFWLMGEVVHGDYSRWVHDAKLDSTTNYECYKGLFSSHNDQNYFEIAYGLNRQFGRGGICENIKLYNFADNHDVNRVASRINKKEHLYPLYTLLMTMPGVPSIYYGSEWELEGEKINGCDDGLRPDLNLYEMNKRDGSMIGHIKNMNEIRKNSKSLKYGNYRQVFVSNKQFCFAREHEGEETYIVLNASDSEAKISASNMPSGKYYDMLNNEEVYIDHEVALSPSWGRVLRRVG